MKLNWKVRFKNKVWLVSFFSVIISFVYAMLSLFDIYPSVTQNIAMQIVDNILMFLGLIGVIVDPTTSGFNDSDRAMSYEEPWKDDYNAPGFEAYDDVD